MHYVTVQTEAHADSLVGASAPADLAQPSVVLQALVEQ